MMNDLESKYYQYLLEHKHLSQEHRSDLFEVYLPFFSAGATVLDVGCGDGTFMEMLQAKGCTVVGVDIDPDMVDICRAKGLDVEQADAIEYLTRSPEEQYNFVVASNFIEHLPSSVALELLTQIHRVLKPGGKVLLATPNPESLIVHLHEFWRDATHVRLYNRQLLDFLLWYCNFDVVNSGVNEKAEWQFDLNSNGSSIEPAADRSMREYLDETREYDKENAEDERLSSIQEVLAGPAYIVPLSAWGRLRIVLARWIYRVIREVDLRLYRTESSLAQLAEIVDERLSKLEMSVNQLTEVTDRKHSKLVDTVNRLAENSEGRVSDMEKSFQFLTPPREIYVLGQKRETGQAE